MDMPPQLAVGAAPAGRALNLPFAEQPNEQQINLLAKQMLQQQQLIAMQQMRIDSLTTIQDHVAAQNTRLQELTVATIRLAEEDTAATKEALAASRQENLAKDARIAELEAQLARQKDTYTESQEAARQALATQAIAMEAIKKEKGILGIAFYTMEEVTKNISTSHFHGIDFAYANPMQRYYYIKDACIPAFNALSLQVQETRALLQQNIQSQATAAQNMRDQ